jgi:hypothetical protein
MQSRLLLSQHLQQRKRCNAVLASGKLNLYKGRTWIFASAFKENCPFSAPRQNRTFLKGFEGPVWIYNVQSPIAW